MDAFGYDTTRRLDRKEQLFDIEGAQVGDEEVLYLDFGISEGQSLRYCPNCYTALILNLDADLNSSTILVLNALKDAIIRGTFVYLGV